MTTLSLANSGLTNVPPDVYGATDLVSLDLSGNSIANIGVGITALTASEVLDLSGNNLPTIPREIALMTNLTNLDISGNPITHLSADLRSILRTHINNPQIHITFPITVTDGPPGTTCSATAWQ